MFVVYLFLNALYCFNSFDEESYRGEFEIFKPRITLNADRELHMNELEFLKRNMTKLHLCFEKIN